MKIIISKLLEDTLEYWPKKFTFSDMNIKNSDSVPFLNLFEHLLTENLLYKDDYIDFISTMSWCIHNAFSQKSIELYNQNGSCNFIHQKDLDIDYIIERFKENMKESSWQEFTKKENMEIVYDIENCRLV